MVNKLQLFLCFFFFSFKKKLDGTIIAPTDFKVWGKGLLQWLQFTKLMGLTIQGNGIIDGRGSAWWQVSPYDDPIDDEFKLLIPLNSTVQEKPQAPVTHPSSNSTLWFLRILCSTFSKFTLKPMAGKK